MNPRRFATVAAAFCGSVGLAGWVVASLAGVGYAPQATAMGNAAVANADVVTAAESVTGTATYQDEAFHCRLPLRSRVLGLRELGDIGAGVFERYELATRWQRDRVVELAGP